MGLNTTMQGDRIQITIYGRRNAGKSSIINAITGQDIAIVSDVKGTTTDPVSKAMEILPLGPCMVTDTPGLDDEGELGAKRIEKALRVLDKTDIVLLISDISSITAADLNSSRGLPAGERQIIALAEEKRLPYIIVLNQTDRIDTEMAEEIKKIVSAKNAGKRVCLTSVLDNTGIEDLKEQLVSVLPQTSKELGIIDGLAGQGDIVLLVVPVDSAAPKGRLIMPQQQVIRDLLDHHAVAVVTQVPGIKNMLGLLGDKVKMVITDSQVFKEVSEAVPDEIPLTSFSILFEGYKASKVVTRCL